MPNSKDLYMANLAFLLEYDDGTENDEIEYELLKIAFQDRGMVHYDRENGGNFRDLEQEVGNVAVRLKFASNMLESIFRNNEKKSFSPFIVVGYNDLAVDNHANLANGEFFVELSYRLLQDLNIEGTVSI